MVVIKRIKNAKEYDNSNLRDTCVFHVLRRADEADGADAIKDLRNRADVAEQLRNGRTVLAVYNREIEVPVVLENVKPVDSNKTYVAAARILVKINIGREFDSWVRQQFADPFKMKFRSSELLRTLIKNGIGNDFTALFNMEKEELLLKYGINSTNFPELGENLRGWCSVVKVLAFQPEVLSSHRSEFFNEIKDEIDKILKPTFIELLMRVLEIWKQQFLNALVAHPFKMLGIVVAVFLAIRIIKGCMPESPVSGSVELICSQRSDSEAAGILRREAESRIAEAFSKRGIPWSSGKDASLFRPQWADLLKEIRDFANRSDGEFSYKDISDTRASMRIHPDAIKSFTFDVTALNGRTEYVSEVARAFGVSFAGRNVIGPKPIRKKAMAAAMKSIKDGKVKVVVNGNTLMFLPNYAKIGKGTINLPQGLTPEEFEEWARKFWKEAAVKFESYPKRADEFAAEFKELDHDYADGFEEALTKLSILSESIRQESEKAASFLADCNQDMLLFTAPSDRPKKMACVDAAIQKMKRVRNSVESLSQKVRTAKVEADRKAEDERIRRKHQEELARLRESFDGEIARFDATKDAWLKGVGDLIHTNNAQVARKAKLRALRDEITSARERKDFSEIASFTQRIEAAKALRLKVSKSEDVIAQKIAPTLALSYVDNLMGGAWAKRMKKGFAAIEGGPATVDERVAKFEQTVIKPFCPIGTKNRTLEKALNEAQNLAGNVRYNHDAKSVRAKGETPSGTEVDLIAQCETALASLVRAQRKALQPAR